MAHGMRQHGKQLVIVSGGLDQLVGHDHLPGWQGEGIGTNIARIHHPQLVVIMTAFGHGLQQQALQGILACLGQL
jgi:hypothetical protein